MIGIEQMTRSDVGTALKEIIFLLYLYFSTNAIAYQQGFKQKNEDRLRKNKIKRADKIYGKKLIYKIIHHYLNEKKH